MVLGRSRMAGGACLGSMVGGNGRAGAIGALVAIRNLSGVFDSLLLLAFYMLDVALTVDAVEPRFGAAAPQDPSSAVSRG